MSKARALRELLARPGLVPAVGAHDALSAKLIEAAGFPVVWSSSFTVSAAQRAMPDVNLLTMTETLEAARHIDNAVSVPVIADCDNGYGNVVNVVRTVEEYERAGIAGICMEDNLFPKKCSLYPGMRRELASIEEHAGKIRAARKAQRDPATVIIARSEALIAGWGMKEALRRAYAYAEAGADMILMHSKAPTAAEVLEFMRLWDRPTPIVVVPTLYPSVTFEELEAAGVKLVIWANQVLRGAVKGVQETLATLRRARCLDALAPHIVTLEEIYRHVGVDEFKQIETEFLPRGASDVRAVIIAAGSGKSLLPLTEDRPQCMLDIKGRTVLERQLETLRACGVQEIAVVRGYRKETVTAPGVRFYDNDAFDESGELASLFAAEPELHGRVLFLYSDILFERAVLEKVLRAEGDVVIAVDRAWVDQRDRLLPLAKPVDLVVTSDPPRPGRRSLGEDWRDELVLIGQRIAPEAATGEFIGLAAFSPRGVELARETHARAVAAGAAPFHEAASIRYAAFTDLLQTLVATDHPVTCVSTWKGWLEIDTFEDYQRAWAEIRS
ncbi:MAG TPA: isocitrate lyase/phosphoenolpyruvate mutase family protein [Methylomirabilota bacterium]|jgi:phosphoenolpyruvate phosphomutase|nr:isocitrate lyase/phosphoenolpyruvate mutase family protein [Methylomirabilota bacterium]